MFIFLYIQTKCFLGLKWYLGNLGVLWVISIKIVPPYTHTHFPCSCCHQENINNSYHLLSRVPPMCQALCVCYLIYFRPQPCEVRPMALRGLSKALVTHWQLSFPLSVHKTNWASSQEYCVETILQDLWSACDLLIHPLADDIRKQMSRLL